MLSKKTKYGIKALTYLANQESKIPVSIAVIAKNKNSINPGKTSLNINTSIPKSNI